MIVYYSCPTEINGVEWLVEEPTSLYDWLRSDDNPELQDLIVRCPATVKEAKKTFIFTTPFSIEVDYEADSLNVNLPEEVAEQIVVPITPDFELFSMGPALQLFAEKPLVVSQTPAYYHPTSLHNMHVAMGAYDISKWFRPLVCGISNKGRKPIKLKAGDAMYYVRFETDEPIEFKRFSFSPELEKIQAQNINMKTLVSRRNLQWLYNLAKSSGQNKSVLREIKANLLE